MSLGISFAYIAAALLFTLGLKMLGSPRSARRGNLLSSLGMLLAVAATLLDQSILDYRWILLGLAAGSVVGVMAARLVAMTAMPEMVALLNGSGGGASLLLGWVEYQDRISPPPFTAATVVLAVLIGGVTFSGSLVAWAKLSDLRILGWRVDRPLLFRGQHLLNLLILGTALLAGWIFVLDPAVSGPLFLFIVASSLLLGCLTVLPIGGADMPVVIALLNSCSGLAACAAGFVIQNNILIVAGSLVGASGIILTSIMCKSMNRSLTHVLVSGFGAVASGSTDGARGTVKPISAEEAYLILEAADTAVFVPGYGLAVAQAQHVVKELGELLEGNGCEVRHAIHPVAGRMPGHMNVLLAEADVSYDQLVEMDEINPVMATVDVAMVIGANDVVNPAAREDPGSLIHGMPIIDVDRARTVIVLKRSMGTGFAGIQNPLFLRDNTRMLFGDARESLRELVSQFKHA